MNTMKAAILDMKTLDGDIEGAGGPALLLITLLVSVVPRLRSKAQSGSHRMNWAASETMKIITLTPAMQRMESVKPE